MTKGSFTGYIHVEPWVKAKPADERRDIYLNEVTHLLSDLEAQMWKWGLEQGLLAVSDFPGDGAG